MERSIKKYCTTTVEKSSVFVLSEIFDSALDEIILNFKLQNIHYFHVTKESLLIFSDFIIIDFKIIDFTIENLSTGDKITLSSISGFLYRGGSYKLDIEDQIDEFINRGLIEIANNLKDEIIYLKKLLFEKLISLDKVLGNPYTTVPDKIKMLELAYLSGLSVPNIQIVSRKSEFELYKNHITKPLTDNVLFGYENSKYTTYTIGIDQIDNVPDTFFPSLIQEKIIKDYELRVFFLGEKLYPSAIICDEYSLDYRKESVGFCNAVPYTFTEIEEKNVLNFIKSSKQNIGSIDLIRDTLGNLYFLEINPQGAFEWISESCNYNLPKRIAEYYI